MPVESAADLAAFFADWDSATYVPAGGGAAETIACQFDAIAPLEQSAAGEAGGQATVKRRRLLARRAAFAVAPAVGAGFTVGGVAHRARHVAGWRDDPTNQIVDITLELVA